MTTGHVSTELGRVKTKRARGVVTSADLEFGKVRRNILRAILYGSILAGVSKFGPGLVSGKGDGVASEGVKTKPAGGVLPSVAAKKESWVDSGRDLVDVAFQNPIEQKAEIRTRVDEFKEKYRSEQVDKSIARAKELDTLVRDKIIGRGSLPSEVADLVMGQVIVESSGNPKAVAFGNKPQDEKAAGLVQIGPDMARFYNMKVSNDEGDERFNVDLSLNVLTSELAASSERWGNWGFAFWEWHAGADKIYEAVQTYGADWFERLPSIHVPRSLPNSTSEAARRISLYKQKISEWNLNVFKMFEDGKIQEMFRGKEWNQTDEYLLRVVAAAELYREAKTKELVAR